MHYLILENSHNKSSTASNSGSILDLKVANTQNAVNNELVKKKLKNLNIFKMKSDVKFIKNVVTSNKKNPKIDKVTFFIITPNSLGKY